MPRIADGLYRVARLETAFRPRRWDFAEREVARIDAHWADALAEKPKMFDGAVLMLADVEIVTAPEGDILRGCFFETRFRNLLAWFDFGVPDGTAFNGFAMAALRGRDGAFLLGEMGAHTANAGQIYFPAGTPDRNDIFGDRVDLAASVARELEEETGFAAEEAPPAPGWAIVVAERKIACIQERLSPLSAAEARARAETFLAGDPDPELAGIHIVRGPQDIDAARMPGFIQTFLRDAFVSQPAG